MFYFCYMKNKTAEINNLLYKFSIEDFSEYEIVDYWDADTTAIGLKKGNILIYIYQHLIFLLPIIILSLLKILGPVKS